jgi:hypothetical protein
MASWPKRRKTFCLKTVYSSGVGGVVVIKYPFEFLLNFLFRSLSLLFTPHNFWLSSFHSIANLRLRLFAIRGKKHPCVEGWKRSKSEPVADPSLCLSSEECKAECPLLVVRRVNESFESFGDFCGRFESFEGQSFKRLLL